MDRHGGPPVPVPSVETHGNGALNKPENPSWSEGDQFTLDKPDAKCREGASHLAALVKQAQRESEFTLGVIGNLSGTETPYVSKALDVEHPHKVLQMFIAAVLLDKKRVVLRGLNAMAGCGLVELPKMSDEEFRRRVTAWAAQSKAHRAQLDEALGEKP